MHLFLQVIHVKKKGSDLVNIKYWIASVMLFLMFSNTAYADTYRYDETKLNIVQYTYNGKNYLAKYTYDSNGNLLKRQVVSLDSPGSVSFSNASFDVVVTGIKASATSVRFPTWTNSNGQDDLNWYNGEKIIDGIWKVTIPFQNHNYEKGKYITHVYVDGTYWGGKETVVTETTTIQSPAQVGLSAGSYDVYLEGVGEQVVKVLFPTWTIAGGQDDIIWIKGERVSENTWRATVRFNNHNQEVGSYMTHIYSYDQYGNRVNNGSAQTIVNSAITIPTETSFSNASLDIIAYGISPTTTKVQFPTWTEHNGQDDLRWYQGEKIDTGIWKVTIPFSNHNHEKGKYITHIYDDRSLWKDTGAKVIDTTAIRAPASAQLSANSYDVYIDRVGDTVAKVLFPTWTIAGGQDDIKWMEGQKVSKGTWKVTVPFKDHHYEKGQYTTHIYSYDTKGNRVYLGSAVTTVQ